MDCQISKDDIKTLKAATDIFIRHDNNRSYFECQRVTKVGHFDERQSVEIECNHISSNGDFTVTLSSTGKRPGVQSAFVSFGSYDYGLRAKSIINLLKPGDIIQIEWIINAYHVFNDSPRDYNLDECRLQILRAGKYGTFSPVYDFLIDAVIRRNGKSPIITVESEPVYQAAI